MRDTYLYVHDLRSSGVVRNAITFAEHLARSRPTTLIAGYDVGFFREEAARGGFRLKTLANRPGVLPRYTAAWRLNRWLRGQPAGVLMSVGNMGHPTPWFGRFGLDHIKRIYSISNEVVRDDGWRSVVRQRWMEMLMRDGAKTILVGVALGRIGIFARALAAGTAVEIPNGVDVDRALAMAAAPVPHRWLEEDVPVVLGIGRLRPQKNFDLLIAGVGRARQQRRLRLAIIGGGATAEAERLQGLAQAAGLGDDFLLAGETDNVFAWLSRSAVFALSSRWETSSLVLLEALATGTPVIASRLAGDAAKVLDEGRYGLLCDGVDPESLATALLAQVGAHPARPGDRARLYGETSAAYARVIDDVLATLPGTSAPETMATPMLSS